MRQVTYYLLLTVMIVSLGGCASKKTAPGAVSVERSATVSTETEPTKTAQETGKENKTLVVYFSCPGNTQELAEAAAEKLKADLYRIEPITPYTAADIAYYTDCRADREQADPNARPEIQGGVEDMEQYDTIILGYPIWHGQAPRIISTFLESYDFSGKTIIPFCTSQSSGIGSSDRDLHSLCTARWKDGKRFPADGANAEIGAWLEELGL